MGHSVRLRHDAAEHKSTRVDLIDQHQVFPFPSQSEFDAEGTDEIASTRQFKTRSCEGLKMFLSLPQAKSDQGHDTGAS